MAEVPTFKLVLVGDGGTGKVRSSLRLDLALSADLRIVSIRSLRKSNSELTGYPHNRPLSSSVT